MDSGTCFAEYNGRQYAILNWQLRQRMNDAIISRPLLKDELVLFGKYKRQGKEDAWIFRQLFPPHVPPRKAARKDLRKLGKNQLIHLILNKLNSSIPSLKNMTKPDLCTLYLALGRLGRSRGLNLVKAIAKADPEKDQTEPE